MDFGLWEHAVQVVEARVPFGRKITTLLMSLAVFYGVLYFARAILKEFLVPLADACIVLFSYASWGNVASIPASHYLARKLLPWIVAIALLLAVWFVINRITRRIYAALKDLEKVIKRYQTIFWQPLDSSERRQLVSRLTALGNHSVLITA